MASNSGDMTNLNKKFIDYQHKNKLSNFTSTINDFIFLEVEVNKKSVSKILKKEPKLNWSNIKKGGGTIPIDMSVGIIYSTFM